MVRGGPIIDRAASGKPNVSVIIDVSEQIGMAVALHTDITVSYSCHIYLFSNYFDQLRIIQRKNISKINNSIALHT